MILDDIFSGLDRKTETEVVNNLLGPKGLFRKSQATVFWVTTASKSYPSGLLLIAFSSILTRSSETLSPGGHCGNTWPINYSGAGTVGKSQRP